MATWAAVFFYARVTHALVYVLGGLLLWMRTRAKDKSLLEALPTPWDADDDEAFRP